MTFLTDVSAFNLSEQIRSCVLLPEDKWSRKKLELYVDFDEYMIYASEELLKHVWINLLDNAIKFSPEYGILRISICQDASQLLIYISNNGKAIPSETQKRYSTNSIREMNPIPPRATESGLQ